MAYRRVQRNDDHRYPSWATPTKDDVDEDPEETSSFVNKEPQETTTIYTPEIPVIVIAPVTSTSHSPTMSDKPQDGESGRYGRPTGAPGPPGPPPYKSYGYDEFVSSSSSAASTTLRTAYGEYNSAGSSTSSATPTRPVGDASSPAPTDDDRSNLQHGTNNGPNRTPVYAAAGITPVVVIILGFFVFCFWRKRRRQKQPVVEQGQGEEMKMHPKPGAMPYVAPITPPSPPPAAVLLHSPSTPLSNQPPTASSSQPVILGPIPSGSNGAYLTGIDTSDLVSMTSAGGISRQGTIVDRDPFADGRSLEEAPPPYRPSSLPPVSIASTSRNSSIRISAPPNMASTTYLIENPFSDPEDDEISEISGPTVGRNTDAISDVSDLSYQVDPIVGRSRFA